LADPATPQGEPPRERQTGPTGYGWHLHNAILNLGTQKGIPSLRKVTFEAQEKKKGGEEGAKLARMALNKTTTTNTWGLGNPSRPGARGQHSLIGVVQFRMDRGSLADALETHTTVLIVAVSSGLGPVGGTGVSWDPTHHLQTPVGPPRVAGRAPGYLWC